MLPVWPRTYRTLEISQKSYKENSEKNILLRRGGWMSTLSHTRSKTALLVTTAYRMSRVFLEKKNIKNIV